MVVQHNISAMNANRYFGINNSGLSKSLEKLSSGFAINRAGDNAAGLAVSEKMRAQISGLTQATKNAEDGISMIQTFEGALSETDSILQRMRTLAVQSANGTYQNDVDREAIQLEYDQLNDELNQIADTDFNGVVVLNGGQMADGLKAVNGEFNYGASGRVAKQLGAADINKLDSQSMDNAKSAKANYDMADALWFDFGFDRNDADTTNEGPDSVEVTFKYDATKQTWSAVSATGGASIDALLVNTAANNGGFQVGSTSTTGAAGTVDKNVVNVVLDGTELVNGDTITVKFNNPSAKNTAIENIGVSNVDADGLTVAGATGSVTKDTDLKVEITNTAIESTNNGKTTPMTKDIEELFNQLNGATVTTTYAADNTKATTTIKLADGTEVNASKSVQIGDTNFYFKKGADDGTLEIGIANAGKTDIDTTLVKLTAGLGTANANGSTGEIKYTLAVDTAKYASDGVPTATISEPAGQVSKSNSNNASTATLTYTDNVTLQTGARTKDSVNFTFSYESKGLGELKADLDCSARGLGTDKLSLATQEDANAAIDKIDNAINKVSMVRASFGAMQNRLEHKIANLNTNNENLTAAESRIRDTDMAQEMTNFTKNQILSQASQAMLAQANQLPQGVLQLLG